jgi:putative two-component system response regulator
VAEERKKRILVVEDEPEIQELIRTMLVRVGWEAVAALDVPQAVNILRAKPLPDVVLLDLMLPGIDGFELLRQMRAKPVFDNLPVVIVSALADPESIRKGLDLGADRYVTKMGIATNLIKTVQDVLRSGRRKSE